MFDFLKFLRGDKQEDSKDIAKSRLQFVLATDRNNTNPELLEMIKEDIMKVLRSYMDVDDDNSDFEITNTIDDETGKPLLVANIPILNMKRPAGERPHSTKTKPNTNNKNNRSKKGKKARK